MAQIEDQEPPQGVRRRRRQGRRPGGRQPVDGWARLHLDRRPSGCGKSTLLNIMSGIETPTSGSSHHPGGSDAELGLRVPGGPAAAVAHGDGQPAVRPEGPQRAKPRLAASTTSTWCNSATRATSTPASCPAACSNGSASPGRSPIEPDVLFMDEPFSHLDAITARSLRRELHEMWAETKKTIIFVTHDVGEAVELSNRSPRVSPKAAVSKRTSRSSLPSPATPQTKKSRWRRPQCFESSKTSTSSQPRSRCNLSCSRLAHSRSRRSP